MAVNKEAYSKMKAELDAKHVTLVAVSKTKPVSDIIELHELGQLDFGENYVQELVDKQAQLPKDIHWHFIGHLQSNKVKYIAPFIHLIHGVDSLKLLKEINKEAAKNNRIINVLLQVHIAEEETKFGMNQEELQTAMQEVLQNVKVCGLMGMASFSDDTNKVRNEFKHLKELYDRYPQFSILSTGMSGDYKIAVEEGSTMVRIGSLIFGERNYTN
jgi:pyridoxal phosphate enzyme (YggS family)